MTDSNASVVFAPAAYRLALHQTTGDRCTGSAVHSWGTQLLMTNCARIG